MALPKIFRIPRPKTFLYLISLRTATELITLTLLINKVSGFYGILALLTGYDLNAVQLSMYIYSILILGLVCYLSPHIRLQSPLQNLALAWIYILDSLINASYTALFGLSWFILLAQQLSSDKNSKDILGPGGKTMNDTAGFTDPDHTVDHVDVIATPKPGAVPGDQDAVTIGYGDGSGGSALGAVFQSGSVMSITVISALWLIRIYFMLIVMAYARGVLRQSIIHSSSRTTDFGLTGGSENSDLAENPFRLGREEGEGWKGRLGRVMTAFPKSYWLGKDDDDEWVRGAGERFRSSRVKVPGQRSGVGERERRARSGTGPPPPPINIAGKGSAPGKL